MIFGKGFQIFLKTAYLLLFIKFYRNSLQSVSNSPMIIRRHISQDSRQFDPHRESLTTLWLYQDKVKYSKYLQTFIK